MVVGVVRIKNNYMPTYTFKCPKCHKYKEMFFGKIIENTEIADKCLHCGNMGLVKIPTPICNANFKSGSRKSIKTRTGVGEIQFAQGAKEQIEKAL